MESLANLECFVRSAETGSFSAAARLLALTPAAVSRNVAMLERNLGVRLFQRSTRKLSLTETGEHFLASIGGNLHALQAAIGAVTTERGEPAGVLRVSLSPSFGIGQILPLMPQWLARYPLIRPDWHFENRPVDLIAEGFDAAIGGGFALTPGVVSRTLAPAHLIAVASPAYLAERALPRQPEDLAGLDNIVLRASRTGRVRQTVLRNAAGCECAVQLAESMIFNDPVAMREAALLGLGVTLLVVPDALPWLERGELVRLLPDWYVDLGVISLYYPSRTLMPAKTRAFIDFITEHFEREALARRFRAGPD
ncbi:MULTISPECIES: LysR family transcriptional regulator [unclassified Pseudomonas]|uniref:LysR family transcriptional regulator n=1 Tax=unclassified Pseudomonas TaxID=196821 RepID=UPI00088FDFDF|nr:MULTISPECIES: LysR family transcriptional regulator [unclassified Pseudomonas]SCZ08148.1 DNA-binding transcriptional regulator, LysR family [Pseudomonas sp. NFACC37-1]SFN48711.1 DNA-binding transcriptional regulator, LysR family [Pseudomonas sp. NFACC24-1]